MLVFASFHLCGQTKYESITTADGLSQGMVFDMLQDKEGFIWIATKDALNRYDGYDFKVFTNDPFNNFSLSYNTVVRLFEVRLRTRAARSSLWLIYRGDLAILTD